MLSKKHVISVPYANSCGVKFLADGATRLVFIDKGRRFVFKHGEKAANRSEFAAYNASKGTNLHALLTEPVYISKNHRVLVQRYMPYNLFTEYGDGLQGARMCDELEKCISFKVPKQTWSGGVKDIHPGNIGFDSKGKVKIIDYGYTDPLHDKLYERKFNLDDYTKMLGKYFKKIKPLKLSISKHTGTLVHKGKTLTYDLLDPETVY